MKAAAIPIIERTAPIRIRAPQQWGAVGPATSPQQGSGVAQPPMHAWGTAVAPQPLFVGGFKDAIFQGAGFLNPRLSGLGYIAAGALCAAGTWALIHLAGIIFIYPAALATGLGLPGLFMFVTNEPKARPGDVSHPLRVRIGLVLSFMIGSIGGLFLVQFYV